MQTAAGGARQSNAVVIFGGDTAPMIGTQYAETPNVGLPPKSAPGGKRKGPSWIKTKQEKVDEKVEKLLEDYKRIEDYEYRKALADPGAERTKLAKKYFPADEEEEMEAA